MWNIMNADIETCVFFCGAFGMLLCAPFYLNLYYIF